MPASTIATMATIIFCRFPIEIKNELYLTMRAEENTPLSDFFTYDYCTTFFARYSSATIHKKCPLKSARQTIRIAKIAITRTARSYCLTQYFSHTQKNILALTRRKRGDAACRQNTSKKQEFAPINITNTSNHPLFQKHRTDHLCLFVQ